MKKKYWKFLLKITLVLTALPFLFLMSVYFGVFGHLQSKQELHNFKNAEATIVLSSEGELIGRFFSENRTNISFEQIPSYLIDALVATEDSRFYEHKGIDTRSLIRVLFKSLLFNNERSGGGSTISQQLAKNMYGRKNNGPLSLVINKAKEAFLAHRLEKTFTKEEILTLYLNTVSFGENIFGIGTASSRYFNKNVNLLSIEESAVLIGILKANTYYNPRLHPENAIMRRDVVLKQMEKYSYLKVAKADSLRNLPLLLYYADIESDGLADYFLVRVKRETQQILLNIDSLSGKMWKVEEDGLIITTTLNLTLQNYAKESFRDHLSVMQKKLGDQYQTTSGKKALDQIAAQEIKRLNLASIAGEVRLQQIFDWKGSHTDSISVVDSLKQALLILHAGLLAIDPTTGSIKAWVGGIDFKTQPYDQINARRQMASVFKPILYAEAFEEGFEPCQYLDNDSISMSGSEGWSPENFDHSSGGKYSIAGALALSMNIPTYNLYLNVGFEKLDSLWMKLGFSYSLSDNPSLALGTAEASIMETALAYASFANGGYLVSPQTIVSIKTPAGDVIYQNEFKSERKPVLSEKSTILISTILKKAINEGTGSSIRTVFGINLPLAGKTGTSQDYSDAWFAAFNPKLVIITRVGASSRAIHFNNGSYGSGSTLALPLIGLTLKKVQDNKALSRELMATFPELPLELAGLFDCPDFKNESLLDNLINIFQKKNIPTLKENKKGELKKRNIFDRLFGR